MSKFNPNATAFVPACFESNFDSNSIYAEEVDHTLSYPDVSSHVFILTNVEVFEAKTLTKHFGVEFGEGGNSLFYMIVNQDLLTSEAIATIHANPMYSHNFVELWNMFA